MDSSSFSVIWQNVRMYQIWLKKIGFFFSKLFSNIFGKSSYIIHNFIMLVDNGWFCSVLKHWCVWCSWLTKCLMGESGSTHSPWLIWCCRVVLYLGSCDTQICSTYAECGHQHRKGWLALGLNGLNATLLGCNCFFPPTNKHQTDTQKAFHFLFPPFLHLQILSQSICPMNHVFPCEKCLRRQHVPMG